MIYQLNFAQKDSCPIISAGPKYENIWEDFSNINTPMKINPGEYIEFLMVWVEN